MTITNVEKDYDNLTFTLVAEFAAPVEKVWQLWADPRQLERWWGPPAYPATFEEHNLTPGGKVTYFMTGPEGDRHGGWWRVSAIDAPRSLEFVDGFADETGNPVDDMPLSTVRMQLSEHAGGTRMEMRSTFESREHMEKLTEMGFEEGIRASVGQMDALLAA